jgi:replicative DNA helicase
VVDYLQMLEFDGGAKRGMNRQQELAAISRRLKALAKELKCPVITAVQLNDDGKIRESRDASFDADNVLFIAEDGIIAKKMRNAERGMTMPLRLNGNFQRFEEFIPEPKATKPKSSRQYADF